MQEKVMGKNKHYPLYPLLFLEYPQNLVKQA